MSPLQHSRWPDINLSRARFGRSALVPVRFLPVDAGLHAVVDGSERPSCMAVVIAAIAQLPDRLRVQLEHLSPLLREGRYHPCRVRLSADGV